MTDVQVSDDEKERLLAEIGVEPSSMVIRRAPPPPPEPEAPPAVAAPEPPAPEPEPEAKPEPEPAPRVETRARAAPPPPAPAAPRAPSRLWVERRLIAGVLTLAAGSAWTAMWMSSGRASALGLALLGMSAGAWILLRPKKY